MREALGITCGAALDMFLHLSFYSQIDLVCSYFYSLRFCVKVEMTYIALGECILYNSVGNSGCDLPILK